MANTDQNRWFNYGIIALIVALVAAGVYSLSTKFETVLLSVNKGYSLEAFQNPYLAAEQFLNARDIPTENAVDLSEIENKLSRNDTILLLNNRAIAGPYHDKMMDWVQQGGHLIITAQNLWGEEYGDSGDPFLDNLGVRMENAIEDEVERAGEAAISKIEELANEAQDVIDGEENKEEDDQSTEGNQCNAYSYRRLSNINYADNEPAIQVQFGSYAHIADASGDAISNQGTYPNNILQYEVGEGMITALTGHGMWNNHNIGWYDHAFFLWLLAGNGDRVWFVYDKESDSLFSLITKHLLEPFVAGLTLLALCLWYRAKRFGPIAPEPSRERRSLLEHLNASAKFNWRHQQLDSLIHKQREDIKSHYIKRYCNHHDQDTIFSTLAKSSQLTKDEVQWALTTETPYKEQEFTQLVRRLQRLRNAV